MLGRLAAEFEHRFGRRAGTGARAPGRVNLIGEHTDYCEGFVLPCAIDRHTFAVAAPRDDRRLRAFSLDVPGEVVDDLDALERRADWGDYVRASAWALEQAGHPLPGLDLGVASRVPRESGLSSSAALGVAVARVWVRLAGLTLDRRALADLVHRGECNFVGVGCGILDQYASALGQRGHALAIDCRDRSVTPVPLDPSRTALLVAHSGVSRALAAGGYRERVDECAAALAAARRSGIAPGARALRDLSQEQLPELASVLPERLLRRVRHVVTENARVGSFRRALEAGELEGAGQILRAGMRSLRDDYQVSTPELDALCEIGDAQPGCHGSRLTGAGFGGCSLHLVASDAAPDVAAALTREFVAAFGRDPRVVRVEPADGAIDLDL